MRAPGISFSFSAMAASVAPDEMPTSMPSSAAERSAQALASPASTWITPSSSETSRFFGMKPAPMPWIGCGLGEPPEITGEAAGSTAKTFNFGQRAFNTCATPVMCPPVPTPVMIATGGLSAKSAWISSDVVRTCPSMLAGFSNCCGIQLFGVVLTISRARAMAPFMPFSRGVRSKLAP